MNEYANYNAQNVLIEVNKRIEELSSIKDFYKDYHDDYHKREIITYKGSYKNPRYCYKLRMVYDRLSIFDWWKDTLSLSQLKQMKSFLENAIKLGFCGYVCFKVGAVGCSHGMWAHRMESTDGYSPEDTEILFHSFRSGDNYYGLCHNGEWLKGEYKLSEIEKLLA